MRDWTGVTYLSKLAEVRGYLADRYGLKASRATLYRWSRDEFMPLPLHPETRPDRQHGTRGVIETAELDAWVAARFHLRPAALAQPAS